MITCAVEPFPPFLEEVKPIFPIHWKELALHQDKVPLDPQYDIYLERGAQPGCEVEDWLQAERELST